MYFILYFIREAVNLPMPFLILLSSLPLTEKTVKVIFLLSIISRTLTIRPQIRNYAPNMIQKRK